MRQIFTILLDSLRMLRAKKLFWVALGLSTFLGLAYMSIGFKEDGYTIGFGLWEKKDAFFRAGRPEGEWLYVELYRNYINRLWLGSGAVLLALISTVSVFPEFTREGAVEVSLSKPVSRVKLFVVKYVGCLLFVLIQMSLFAVMIFVAMYWRLGYANWSVFWLVPVVTFVFSLVHCVAVFIGVKTRSSLVALLVGICFWGAILLMQWTQDFTYKMGYAMPAAGLSTNWETGQIEEGAEDEATGFKATYDFTDKVMMPLPKVREVTLSLQQLVKFRDSRSILEKFDLNETIDSGKPQMKMPQVEELARGRHSLSYYYLTSLGFELFVLGAACWVFVRRDY